MKRIATLIIAVSCALLSSSCSSEKLFQDNSTGMVTFNCPAPFEGKTIDIYYHIPEGDVANMPVQIVMHGMGRNGDGYRDVWVPAADKYGFIVVTPTFSDEYFGENEYNDGNVVTPAGYPNPKDQYTYVLVDEVFDYFVKNSNSKAKEYNIYGHSAGSQFVHKFMMYYDSPKCKKAVCANAGRYTFPDPNIEYPYGLGVTNADLEAFYAKDILILLGTADTLRTSNLRQTPEADATGMNRFERGNNYFEFCKNDAEAKGVPFNWSKAYVEGVGHSNKKMGPAAADLIYGTK